MGTKTVLLLSQPEDAHIPPVQKELCQMGVHVAFCDLADFPERIEMAARISSGEAWTGRLLASDGRMDFDVEDITSVYWRRPQPYHAPEGYASPVRDLLDQESYRGFLGLLLGAPRSHQPFWVSEPQAIRAAEFKPAQLATAARLGLRVPRTLLTNSPDAVRAFYEECEGHVITKAVWRGILDPRGPYTPGQPRFIYTSEVLREHLTLLDGVRASAHLFQERVEKALELRVVVMGRQVFAVEILSQSAEACALDWRRSYKDLRYRVHQLPQDLETTLCQLVRCFRLQYASMDLILTPQGEYVWLECNPNGQYYWIQPPTGLPMAHALAQLLVFPQEYGLW